MPENLKIDVDIIFLVYSGLCGIHFDLNVALIFGQNIQTSWR